MAKLFFGMNVSLDGYVDHQSFGPGPVLFRHFIDMVGNLSGSLYGRHLYEIMRYWDEGDPEWPVELYEFAVAWRAQHKWVVSTTLDEVGPNATLIRGDLETAVRKLKAEVEGDIEVGGPKLAHSLTELGLIDEYWLYVHPVVLGGGTPFFAGPRPPLRLVSSEQIEDVMLLKYAP